MKRAFTVVLSLLLPLGISLAQEVINEIPTAYSNGTDIVVQWRTVSEASVARFEIERASGTEGNFLLVGAVAARHVDNSSYEFVDRQVFKYAGGIYQYKVIVIMDDGKRLGTPFVTTVSHLSSTARRTWGSIKAMFR